MKNKEKNELNAAEEEATPTSRTFHPPPLQQRHLTRSLVNNNS